MKNKIVGIFICMLLIAASTILIGTTVADWDPGDGHKMHWPQLPDEDGWDVSATYLKEEQWGIVLADDWKCSESGQVTDIHFWGSWKGGNEGTIKSFWIAIHEDIPEGPNVPYSRPGRTLWEREFRTWSTVPKDSPTYQGWYCVETGNYIENDHRDYFQYNIVNIQNPFHQVSGKIYWLAITAEVERVPGAVQPLWGWKSTDDHWNDDACWGYWGELNWIDIYEPGGGLEPITNEFWAQVNPNGYLEEGSGTDAYGDKWYYYENTGWWNVWFYDHPFDYERYKEITIEFDFNPEPGGWATIALNWATPYWEPGCPPPIPPLTPGEEQEYITRYILLGEIVEPGHYVFDYTILDYNPEWVSVDIMGMNFGIFGILTHECLPSAQQQSLDLAFVITGEEPVIPDIDIDKLVSADGGVTWSDEVDVELDDIVKFKITVENDGNIDLTNVKIIDTLPSCLEYADNADPIEPSISGNKLTWRYNSLAVGQTKVITFDATAIEEGENINDVNVTGKIPSGAEVTDDDTATVNVEARTIPKIGCEGTLRWSKITPESTVTGIIYVKNIGDAGSELKWSVCGYPTWGTWTFTPSSGTGLKPADGKKPIIVTVVAPNQKRHQFTGQIILCNDENTSDTCTIQASLATPKSKTINSQGLFEDGNIAFLFAIGNFTEEETMHTGHFSFMLFIGFVDGEFRFYTVHDEMIALPKALIQREILVTSKIIIVTMAG